VTVRPRPRLFELLLSRSIADCVKLRYGKAIDTSPNFVSHNYVSLGRYITGNLINIGFWLIPLSKLESSVKLLTDAPTGSGNHQRRRKSSNRRWVDVAVEIYIKGTVVSNKTNRKLH
jgi:hypothetical protein